MQKIESHHKNNYHYGQLTYQSFVHLLLIKLQIKAFYCIKKEIMCSITDDNDDDDVDGNDNDFGCTLS